jgi:signal transduction histidine kinase
VLGDDLRCLITDSGPGIEPQSLPFVFDRLWQSSEHHEHGIGLGLAIAKGIVEAHGGEISVRSKLKVGTTFVFTLPMASELQANLN